MSIEELFCGTRISLEF